IGRSCPILPDPSPLTIKWPLPASTTEGFAPVIVALLVATPQPALKVVVLLTVTLEAKGVAPVLFLNRFTAPLITMGAPAKTAGLFCPNAPIENDTLLPNVNGAFPGVTA